jgi:hypothetical protein
VAAAERKRDAVPAHRAGADVAQVVGSATAGPVCAAINTDLIEEETRHAVAELLLLEGAR